MKISDLFHRFAVRSAAAMGSSWSFFVATMIILVWAITGPLFHYSDTWQLLINTGTTIVTFLMVFLIQNAQNREGQAVQIKLDELIRAVDGARNKILDLEGMSDEDLRQLQDEFKRLCEKRDCAPLDTQSLKSGDKGASSDSGRISARSQETTSIGATNL